MHFLCKVIEKGAGHSILFSWSGFDNVGGIRHADIVWKENRWIMLQVRKSLPWTLVDHHENGLLIISFVTQGNKVLDIINMICMMCVWSVLQVQKLIYSMWGEWFLLQLDILKNTPIHPLKHWCTYFITSMCFFPLSISQNNNYLLFEIFLLLSLSLSGPMCSCLEGLLTWEVWLQKGWTKFSERISSFCLIVLSPRIYVQ